MSDAEYDDELPAISVNSSSNAFTDFRMPSAQELASQREREEECERELILLREQYELATNTTVNPTRLMHSDSSGSEGEAALAAAVNALKVQSAHSNSQSQFSSITEFITALLPHLSMEHSEFVRDYLNIVEKGDKAIYRKITDEALFCICSALAYEGNIWTDEEVVSVGAWLCAVCVCEASGSSTHARRVLHRLLDMQGNPRILSSLTTALCAAAGSASALLGMAECTRNSAGLAADLLAARIVRTALVQLFPHSNISLDPRPLSLSELSTIISCGWRNLDHKTQYTAIQLTGRSLAYLASQGSMLEERGKLLTRLTQATVPGGKNQPEHLQILAGLAMLSQLFGPTAWN